MTRPFEPVRRSVYIGRRYLGRYVQTSSTAFEAFDATDRRIGVFESAENSVAAIDRILGSDGQ
jgi:hypothetical protein